MATKPANHCFWTHIYLDLFSVISDSSAILTLLICLRFYYKHLKKAKGAEITGLNFFLNVPSSTYRLRNRLAVDVKNKTITSFSYLLYPKYKHTVRGRPTSCLPGNCPKTPSQYYCIKFHYKIQKNTPFICIVVHSVQKLGVVKVLLLQYKIYLLEF